MTHLPIFTHPSMPAHAPVAPLRRAIRWRSCRSRPRISPGRPARFAETRAGPVRARLCPRARAVTTLKDQAAPRSHTSPRSGRIRTYKALKP